jgi:hypothetical protein
LPMGICTRPDNGKCAKEPFFCKLVSLPKCMLPPKQYARFDRARLRSMSSRHLPTHPRSSLPKARQCSTTGKCAARTGHHSCVAGVCQCVIVQAGQYSWLTKLAVWFGCLHACLPTRPPAYLLTYLPCGLPHRFWCPTFWSDCKRTSRSSLSCSACPAL